MNKKLSVIIPAYNAEKYIEECLNSLSGLLEEDLEIIVINDGSTDSTTTIVDNCCQKDRRIRLISVENGGVSKARNTGLENAYGEYVMFLDADDYLLKDAFSTLKRCLYGEKCDFTAFARDIIEADGRIWTEGFPFREKETTDKNNADLIMYANSLFNECWGKLFRKSIITEYSIRFPVGVPVGEDLMFVMEYYSHCESTHIFNESLVGYRQHGSSAMKKYSVEDRLKYTHDIYEYSKKYVPLNLDREIAFYNFKVLTNLCREYLKDSINKDVIKSIYSCPMASEIMRLLDVRNIPLYRKHEYFLMRWKLFFISAVYYHAKAKV